MVPEPFQPPKGWTPGHAPVVEPARRFTYTTPAWIRSSHSSISVWSSLKSPAVSPYSVSFAFSIASSSSSNGATATNGTNSSFFQIQLSSGTSTTVGSTNRPLPNSPSVIRCPPVTIVPFLRASSEASSNVSIAASLMIGPRNTSRPIGSPTAIFSVLVLSVDTKSS